MVGDGARASASHVMNVAERKVLLAMTNELRFFSMSPECIVTMLAHERVHLGKEYSMARVVLKVVG